MITSTQAEMNARLVLVILDHLRGTELNISPVHYEFPYDYYISGAWSDVLGFYQRACFTFYYHGRYEYADMKVRIKGNDKFYSIRHDDLYAKPWQYSVEARWIAFADGYMDKSYEMKDMTKLYLIEKSVLVSVIVEAKKNGVTSFVDQQGNLWYRIPSEIVEGKASEGKKVDSAAEIAIEVDNSTRIIAEPINIDEDGNGTWTVENFREVEVLDRDQEGKIVPSGKTATKIIKNPKTGARTEVEISVPLTHYEIVIVKTLNTDPVPGEEPYRQHLSV